MATMEVAIVLVAHPTAEKDEEYIIVVRASAEAPPQAAF
jgi:hypothetical protein